MSCEPWVQAVGQRCPAQLYEFRGPINIQAANGDWIDHPSAIATVNWQPANPNTRVGSDLSRQPKCGEEEVVDFDGGKSNDSLAYPLARGAGDRWEKTSRHGLGTGARSHCAWHCDTQIEQIGEAQIASVGALTFEYKRQALNVLRIIAA
jgi:hypothetical protein